MLVIHLCPPLFALIVSKAFNVILSNNAFCFSDNILYNLPETSSSISSNLSPPSTLNDGKSLYIAIKSFNVKPTEP